MSWMRSYQAEVKRKAMDYTHSPEAAPQVSTPIPAAAVGGEYEIWLAQCKMDWDHLKAYPDHAERDRQKPALLDKYREYLTDWMTNHTHQNDVLIMNLIWAADMDAFEWAITLADFAVTHQLQLTFFSRDPATFTADAVLQYEGGGDEWQQAFAAIFERITSQQWTVNHVLKAKYYKEAGLQAEEQQLFEQAAQHFQTAHELYPNVGVKKRLERCKKQAISPKSLPTETVDQSTESTASTGVETSITGDQ